MIKDLGKTRNKGNSVSCKNVQNRREKIAAKILMAKIKANVPIL